MDNNELNKPIGETDESATDGTAVPTDTPDSGDSGTDHRGSDGDQSADATPDTTDPADGDAEGEGDLSQEEIEKQSRIQTEEQGDIKRVDVADQLLTLDEKVTEVEDKLVVPQATHPSQEAFTVFTPGSDTMVKIGETFSQFNDLLKEGSKKVAEVGEVVTNFVKNLVTDRGIYERMNTFATKSNYYNVHKTMKLTQVTKLGIGWLDYAKNLQKLTEKMVLIDRDLLYPFQQYLAQGLNDPSKFNSTSFRPKYQVEDAQKLQQEIIGWFKGPMTGHIPWGKAFGNNKEATEFVAILLSIRKQIAQLPPETVDKSVNSISNKAKILIDGITHKDGKFTLSETQINHLKTLFDLTARYVELYAHLINMLNELDMCIKDSFQQAYESQ